MVFLVSSPRIRALIAATSVLVAAQLLVSPPSRASDADRTKKIVAEPKNEAPYGIGEVEPMWVEAPDGARIYVEVWRPVALPDGEAPPKRVPVILVMTPYTGSGPETGLGATVYDAYLGLERDLLVPEGYAFALGHVYGTGNSDGCLDLFGPREVAATSAVIEHLGTRRWSNGRVGMTGGSYDAGQALQVAARGTPRARQLLKAVISEAGVVGYGDSNGFDGVPFAGGTLLTTTGYVPFSNLPASERPDLELDPTRPANKQTGACRATHLDAAQLYELSGDFTPWLAERSARTGARDVEAAVLMFQGFHDINVFPNSPIGFFDRIPKQTPHKMVLGQWVHAASGDHRGDWWEMIHAWYDRYLMGDDTGVESWPKVQVEDAEGRWRAEGDWPSVDGRVGQLALNADGSLGATSPSGSSSFTETPIIPFGSASSAAESVFSTPPLAAPLRISGQPALDLWVKLNRDDAHIVAVIEAYGPEGTLLTSQGGFGGQDPSGKLMIVGARSARHLEPIAEGEFRQAEGVPAPVGVPVRIPIRFAVPTDLVIPEGGWLTLRVAGSALPLFPTTPSGANTTVEILHDCESPSVLRFRMPSEDPTFLEVDDLTPPTSLTEWTSVDGGGLATNQVCGEEPVDPQIVVAAQKRS